MKYDQETDYIYVPDEYIEQVAAFMEEEGEFNSSFHKMLQVSKEYRDAELTPYVVYDLKKRALICLVKELYGKKLH